jgi:23S rRNA (adenine2030-N6)-methyltransferase
LRIEVRVTAPKDKTLIGSGLLMVNPPWRLETELELLLPALAAVLGRDGAGTCRLDRLDREK